MKIPIIEIKGKPIYAKQSPYKYPFKPTNNLNEDFIKVIGVDKNVRTR